MTTLTDARPTTAPVPLRRHLAAGALLLGPLVLAAGAMTTPEAGEDGRALVAAASLHRTAWTTGHLLLIAGAALQLVGLAHLAGRLPQRAVLATVGTAWFGLGLLGQALLAAAELVLVPIAATPKATAIPTVDRISESGELSALFLLYLPGTLLGGLLLFAGLRLCRLLPGWAAAMGAAAVLFGSFLEDRFPGGDLVTAAAMVVAFAVALGLVGQRRATDGPARRW